MCLVDAAIMADASLGTPDVLEALESVRAAYRHNPQHCEVTVAPLRKVLEAVLLGEGNTALRAVVNDGLRRLSTRVSDDETMHQILPGLFIGSYHPANNEALLRKHDITHICCCCAVPGRFPGKFKYLIVPADDKDAYDITQHFKASVTFIQQALESGGSVLVHCAAGISRSTTVALAYIMLRHRIPFHPALSAAYQARSACNPNLGFQKQLMAWDAQCQL